MTNSAAAIEPTQHNDIRENLRTERAGQALRLVHYTTGQDNLDERGYRPVL